MRTAFFWSVVAVFAIAIAVLVRHGGGRPTGSSPDAGALPGAASAEAGVSAGDETAKARHPAGKAGGKTPLAGADRMAERQENETADRGNPLDGENLRTAEEERLAAAFDGLTDKWLEPATDGVPMADVDAFAAQFRKVPKARKGECLQRALNLIPDENVMLLAGILMDKSQDAELIRLVYRDVLNRDEDVKRPILQQIFKDRDHPCWADTAWILDVTGERPGK